MKNWLAHHGPTAVFGTSARGSETRTHVRSNRLIVPAEQEPVALQEIEARLGLGDTGGDAFLADTLETAREAVERAADIACITQQWRLSLDYWRHDQEWLTIPVWPLQSIDAVTTFDADGTASSISPAIFDVDVTAWPGRVRIAQNASFDFSYRDFDAIHITYTAGWESGVLVPLWVRNAIKMTAAYMYEHRGDGCGPVRAVQQSGAMQTIVEARAVGGL